ncbi:MAG TPA: PKD domain-containing protein [Terriglobales bacterium]|nr:PKD domain-containing protein [Terriglobales bacterium]
MARFSTCWKQWQVLTVAVAVMCGSLAAAPKPDNGKKAKKATAAATSTTNNPKTDNGKKDAKKDSPKTKKADTPAPAAQAAASSGVFSDSFQASAMQGSLFGTPGIWNTQFAETLLPGQASAGVYVQRYSRDPGGLVFTDANAGWAVGVTKWLELSFSSTGYRRIRVTHPEELTFGSQGRLTSYNPVAPFARNPLIYGPVDWSLGATIGLLSQDRGDPIGLAYQITYHVPYNPTLGLGVNYYGVSTTEPTLTETVMIDKWLGTAGEMAANLGYQHNGTVDAGGVINLPLRDQFTYGFGELFPLHSRLQGVVEFDGNVPFGAGAHTDLFGVPSPFDVNFGIRFNPISWMGINAGYRFGAHSSSKIAIPTNVSGFVFGLSFGPPPVKAAPPPPPPTPTLACSVDTSTVQPGATVHISSTVTPQGLPYTYSWTTTGGKLSPADNAATLDTTGLAPGMYTVTGRVDNGSGGTADCTANVEVREPVRNPPTASCSVEPSSPVAAGAPLTFSAQAASPDNRPLTYAWQVSAGHPDTTSQATLHDDTTGAAPGTVTANLTVTDDRGLTATCSAQGTIQQPPPAPQASLATTLQFKPNSARVDNAAKAALDDVALRLQQDATAKAVIVGSATSDEVAGRRRGLTPAATTKLAEERAVNAKAYLVTEKGISADRIEVRQSTDNPHQAEVWVVPQGASYTGSGQTFDENAVKPAPTRRPRRPRAKTSGGK